MMITNAWLTYKDIPVEAYATGASRIDDKNLIILEFEATTSELDAICLNQDFVVTNNYESYTVLGGRASGRKFTPKDFKGNSGYKINLNYEDDSKLAYIVDGESGGVELLFVQDKSEVVGRRKLCVDEAGLMYVTEDLIGKQVRAHVPIIYEKTCVVNTSKLGTIYCNLILNQDNTNYLETYTCELDFESMAGNLVGNTRTIVLKYNPEEVLIQKINSGNGE